MTKPARAVRNNNPLNIRIGQAWQGELPADRRSPEQAAEQTFEVFESAAIGFRAGAIILLNYQHKHGLHTVDDMIRRWAPPHENDTDRYAAYVASDMGIPRDRPFDFREFPLAHRMLRAMAHIEAGGDYFADEDITAGLVAAGIRPPQHGGGADAAAVAAAAGRRGGRRGGGAVRRGR